MMLDGDGVCESEEVLGCNDEIACNYNFLATENDGSCTYPAESFLNCGGFCLNDIDGDLICDELEIPGCSDPSACNFDIEATDDDGSCFYISTWYEDVDGDGLGDVLFPAESCDQPEGFVLNNTDPCPIDPENDSDGDEFVKVMKCLAVLMKLLVIIIMMLLRKMTLVLRS